MRDLHLNTGLKNVGELPGGREWGKAIKGMGKWKPGLPSLRVALGLNLAQVQQHCTTEREFQHLSLFTFYFKTKLLTPELFGEVPD